MVRGSDDYRVDVLAVEQLPVIRVVAGIGTEAALGPQPLRLVDVADGYDLVIPQAGHIAQQISAPFSGAYGAEPNPIVGALDAAVGRRRRNRASQKAAAVGFFHKRFPFDRVEPCAAPRNPIA